MCRFLQTSLNEINKLRLNWQLASEVIILSLMSPQWNGRRFGLNRNSTGCGEAVFSSTKKWRVMAARVYLSRFLNTHTHTHMQHSHVLTPSSSNVRLLLHTPSNLAPDSILHSLPMSPSVASQQKDPDCAGSVASLLVWECAEALRLSNLGLPPLFVNSCLSNRTTLSPAKCSGQLELWWESEAKAELVFQANK